MSIAGGAVGAGVNGASNGADVQSQFLLTKFMQPTLSDTEWAEMERERSNRYVCGIVCVFVIFKCV